LARNRDCQAANYAKRGLITARRPADLLASFGMMAPPMRHADEADLGAGSRLSAPAFLVRLSPERGFTGAGMRNSGPNWAVPLVAGGWQLLHLAHGRGADHPNHLNESGGVLCRGSSGPSAAHPGSLGLGIASGWRARALRPDREPVKMLNAAITAMPRTGIRRPSRTPAVSQARAS
jgi:hypothetical protein